VRLSRTVGQPTCNSFCWGSGPEYELGPIRDWLHASKENGRAHRLQHALRIASKRVVTFSSCRRNLSRLLEPMYSFALRHRSDRARHGGLDIPGGHELTEDKCALTAIKISGIFRARPRQSDPRKALVLTNIPILSNTTASNGMTHDFSWNTPPPIRQGLRRSLANTPPLLRSMVAKRVTMPARFSFHFDRFVPDQLTILYRQD